MSDVEQQYLTHLRDLMRYGETRENRTGVKTLSIFGHMLSFNIQEGFPLLTTKQVHFKSVLHELLWFISGDTNIDYLRRNGVRIWNEWADDNGNLGPVYGHQWRNWNGIDQLANAIELLKKDPDSRRNIVSAWNVEDIPKMALAPCHWSFQFMATTRYDNGVRELDCMMHQRSADWFLGVPFNIASYSLLTMMVARLVGMRPGRLHITFGDTHLYENHIEQAKEQLSRFCLWLPTLEITGNQASIDDYTPSDFTLIGYEHHPAIKAAVAV